MEYCIDGKCLFEREAAQKYLKELFGFPEYYGKNLDAFHDMLCGLRGVQITVVNGELVKPGTYGSRVFCVLRDAQAENPEIRVVWRENY